jgi:hypothetical protein
MGKYEVVSQCTARIETTLLKEDGFLHEVSAGSFYIDEAAIVQKERFPRYFLPEGNSEGNKVVEWYATLPEGTMLIVVHVEEWESGLSVD